VRVPIRTRKSVTTVTHRCWTRSYGCIAMVSTDLHQNRETSMPRKTLLSLTILTAPVGGVAALTAPAYAARCGGSCWFGY
jgi:hypothetical protein